MPHFFASASEPSSSVFEQLVMLFNTRRYAELETQVRAVLQDYPQAPFAWQLLGGALQMQGKNALEAFQKTAQLTPNDAGAHFNLGVALKSNQQTELAATSYRRALTLKPDYVEARSNLAGALHDLGQLDEAILNYQQALKAQPNVATLHNNLGTVFKDKQLFEQAVASYRQAIQLRPDYADAHYNLGNVLKELDQLDAAVLSYQQAVRLNPKLAEAQSNLGAVFQKLGRADEALPCYQRAMELAPNSAEMHSNLGMALFNLKKFNEAILHCQRALSLNPNYANAHHNLGICFKSIGKVHEAVECFRRAIQHDPEFVSAYNNLGNTLNELENYDEALKSCKHALSLQPGLAEAHNNLGNILSSIGNFIDAQASYRQALEAKPDYFIAHSNLLMASNYISHSTTTYLEESQHYGENVAQKVTTRHTTWQCAPSPQKLRVGLVSTDLLSHPVGFFLEGLLTQLDASRIELVAYTNNPIADELTARIKPCFAQWREIFNLDDQHAADLIHQDGIHLLMDLAGHSGRNRLPLFAWKPAPVQVTWLGFPSTTGVAEMDFILGDPIATPAEDESQFTEQVWRLPESYICLTTPDQALQVSALPALTQHHVTFGSFNNLSKVNDATIAVWARILSALPQAHLLLKTKQLGDASVRQMMLQKFAAHGVTADQLTLEGWAVQRSDHLATYHRVDIALDPFPYPGVTTSVEALWMGVPVLCMQGNRFLSRTAASIAHNAGLPDWIATDEDDYVARAVQFASDLPKLAALRASLREQVRTSPLFDAPRFARNFEAALWGMWQEKMRKLSDDSFSLSSPNA